MGGAGNEYHWQSVVIGLSLSSLSGGTEPFSSCRWQPESTTDHDTATGPGSAAADRLGRAMTTWEAAASDPELARAQEGTVMADTETGLGRPDSGPGPPSYDYDPDWD